MLQANWSNNILFLEGIHLASQEISEGRGTDLSDVDVYLKVFSIIIMRLESLFPCVRVGLDYWQYAAAICSCPCLLLLRCWNDKSAGPLRWHRPRTSWVYLSLFLYLPLVIGTSLSRSHFCLHDQPTCAGCISACRPFLNLHAADPA